MFKRNLLYFFRRTIAFVVTLSLFTTSTVLYPNPATSKVTYVQTYDCYTQSLTNANDDIVKSYDYDAFGNIRASSGSNNTNYEFQGQQLDPESGMYFLRARYYDPLIGRFITRDPVRGVLRNPQTLNPYAYVANNSINLSDPSGEAWWWLLDAAGTAADAISLGNDLANCNWGGIAVDAVGLGLPFVSVGAIKAVGKAANALNKSVDIKIGKHIHDDLVNRGWDSTMIQNTIKSPSKTVPTTDTRHLPDGTQLNDPATAYYREDGSYVVRNDKTGDIVQISDRNNPNWKAPWGK